MLISYLVFVGRMLRPVPARPAAAAVSSSCCISPPQIPAPSVRRRRPGVAIRCAPDDGGSSASEILKAKLKVGSPIVIVEAPLMLKTAASMPSLRNNAGQVKTGDVGRIMARKPKDVWAVRLAAGTYLLDGKYFKPLEVGDEDSDESPDK